MDTYYLNSFRNIFIGCAVWCYNYGILRLDENGDLLVMSSIPRDCAGFPAVPRPKSFDVEKEKQCFLRRYRKVN